MNLFNWNFPIHNFSNLNSSINFDEFYNWLYKEEKLGFMTSYINSNLDEFYQIQFIKYNYGINLENLIIFSDYDTHHSKFNDELHAKIISLDKRKTSIELLIKKFKLKEFL